MKLHLLLLLLLPVLAHAKVIHKKPRKAQIEAAPNPLDLDKDVIRFPGSSSLLVNAKQAFLMDYNTGVVLLEKNADQPMAPSSMTKMLTSYIIEEKLQKKELSLDTAFPVSEKAWRTEGSKTFVPLGAMMKLGDILSGIIIQSGNDACVVAAEGIAGGEVQFAALMNAKAKELGLLNTRLLNSHGLYVEGHQSTARDMANLGAAIIKHHPEYYSEYQKKDFTFNNIKQGNRNPLLYGNEKNGCDGIKTGHTDMGGYGAVLSCVDASNQRYILSFNGLRSVQQRADEARKYLAWARENFEGRIFLKKGDILEPALKVKYGLKPTVRLAVRDEVRVLALRTDQNAPVKRLELNDSIIAPIKEGDVLGKVHVAVNGKDIKADLISLDASEKMGIFKQALSYIKSKLSFLGLDA
ncbi:MAG TPA: D-alanyl-D-alanine carboxypeptidase family protein [Myxococcota bacterium]|nr:D-alanyl-D-alanine carboxypeptidase family protein [Myxococcota bacterium]